MKSKNYASLFWRVWRTLVSLLVYFFFHVPGSRFSCHHFQPWVSYTRGYLLSWRSQSHSSEVLRLLRDFLARLQLFSRWGTRSSVLHTCKPIPPPLLPTLHQNHHHHNQPTDVWKQIIYCPGHCDFTICTKKWEQERQSVFCKAKFIQFKWLFFILRLYSSYFKCTKVSLLLYNDAMADGDMGFSVFFFFFNVLGWQVKKLETL